MAEYIERGALMQFPIRRNHYDRKNGNKHFINGIESVLEYAENLPAADVAPVMHGRWEEASDGDGIVCPFCRTDFCTIIYDTEYFNYCPHCGAQMDEKEDKHEDYT